jgi:hypothetical protein
MHPLLQGRHNEGKMGPFQFPLLGFLLCISDIELIDWEDEYHFQFPLLGFLLCIFGLFFHLFALSPYFFPFNSLYWDFCYASEEIFAKVANFANLLSIPFIGIFVMHPCRAILTTIRFERSPFNSLYWDFCYASEWLVFRCSHWV